MAPITLMYAGLLAFWLLVLSARVVFVRRSEGVSLGDGGNKVLNRRIRGQGNFTEYVPMVLILMGLIEISDGASWILHLIGSLLLLGRLLHGYAFSFTTYSPLRVPGMVLTLVSLGIAGGAAIVQSLSL